MTEWVKAKAVSNRGQTPMGYSIIKWNKITVCLEASLGDSSDYCKAKPSVKSYLTSKKSNLGRLSRIYGRLSHIKPGWSKFCKPITCQDIIL